MAFGAFGDEALRRTGDGLNWAGNKLAFMTPEPMLEGYRRGGLPGYARAGLDLAGDTLRQSVGELQPAWDYFNREPLRARGARGNDAARSTAMAGGSVPQPSGLPWQQGPAMNMPPRPAYGRADLARVQPGQGLALAQVRRPNGQAEFTPPAVGLGLESGPRYFDADQIAQLRAQMNQPQAAASGGLHQVAYRATPGQVTKQVDGREVPMGGNVSYLGNDQTFAAESKQRAHELGMARLRAGMPYDAGAANAAIARNMSSRAMPDTPSQWQLDTAARNAALAQRYGGTSGEQARYAELLGRANPELGLKRDQMNMKAETARYGVDRAADARQYGYDQEAQWRQQLAQTSRDNALTNSDARLQGYQLGLQGKMYGADRGYEGKQLDNETRRYGTDAQTGWRAADREQRDRFKAPSLEEAQADADFMKRYYAGDPQASELMRTVKGRELPYQTKTLKQYDQYGTPTGESLVSIDPRTGRQVRAGGLPRLSEDHADAMDALQRGMPLPEVNRRLQAAGLPPLPGR